jgi:hypothetical protein
MGIGPEDPVAATGGLPPVMSPVTFEQIAWPDLIGA